MQNELLSSRESARRPQGSEMLMPRLPGGMGEGAVTSGAGRHQHVSPVALVTRDPARIKVRSDQLTYRILLGLLDERHFARYQAGRLAEYRQTLPRGRGSVDLLLAAGAGEPWERVLASLELLGDELVDTLLALLAVALDVNGPERITGPFAITAEDILAICQKKKSKGSYPARQRQLVSEQVRALSGVRVSASLLLPDGKIWRVESPLLEILPREQGVEGGGRVGGASWRPWRLKIGEWAGAIPALQTQTALLARRLLRYHGRQQRYEKRLGRYLTVLYRINAHRNAGRVKVSMGVLLEQAGIVLDRDNPGRSREAVERALRRLRSDGVVGRYVPVWEETRRGQEVQERIEQHAYHWWDDYRRQMWLFEPPALSATEEGSIPTEGGKFPTEGGI